MRKLKNCFFSLFLVFFFIIGLSLPVFANGTSVDQPSLPYLENNNFFVDTTGQIPTSIINQANQKAQQLNSKGYQIGGWFFNDTPGSLEEITTKFGNYNRLGYAGHDNGVAISIAINRKGKDGKTPAIFISTGKGIEGLLNDAKVGRIKREVFDVSKTSDSTTWYQGFLNTIDALIGELNGENKYQDLFVIFWNSLSPTAQIIIIIIVIILIFLILKSSSGSSSSGNYYSPDSDNNSSGGGGGFGGGGAGDD